jgi:hypothetical protein
MNWTVLRRKTNKYIYIFNKYMKKCSTSLSIKKMPAGHWWLTPIILANQEADIRRIQIQSQPRQIVPQDPILKIPITKKDW